MWSAAPAHRPYLLTPSSLRATLPEGRPRLCPQGDLQPQDSPQDRGPRCRVCLGVGATHGQAQQAPGLRVSLLPAECCLQVRVPPPRPPVPTMTWKDHPSVLQVQRRQEAPLPQGPTTEAKHMASTPGLPRTARACFEWLQGITLSERWPAGLHAGDV